MSQEMKITMQPDTKMSKKAKKPSWYKSALRNKWSGFFVRNLPSGITKGKLWGHFSTCGIVTEVKILNTEDDCALIKYATKEMAKKAMKELHGKVFLQKKLQLCWQRKEYLQSLLKSYYHQEEKKTKLEMKDYKEILKLKGTIVKLEQEKSKIAEENKELKKSNKNLKKENLKLCGVIKDLVTQS